MNKIILAISIFLSIVSLVYSYILTQRVIEYSSTHIGGDTIFISYAVPLFALLLALFLFKQKELSTKLKYLNLSVCIFATSIWLGLHLSGRVVSHASLFN